MKALADSSPEVMAAARIWCSYRFVSFWLSGEVAVEKTIASHQSIGRYSNQAFWSETLVEKLGIPSAILGDMVLPALT